MKIEVSLPTKTDIINSFGLGPGGSTQKFMSNEILKLSIPYIPMVDGFLMNSATIASDGTYIMFDMPYAKRLWYGELFNFTTTFHPLASAKWVEKAVTIHRDSLITAVNNFIRKGV